MKTLLISHFWNEEYLLPHWIQHHKGMFDHVVMIDYASTDRSVEIIKTLAPEWEIRPSRNQFFDAPLVDQEVMDIELEFDGYWKLALNTTEFLLVEGLDLHAKLLSFEERFPGEQAYCCKGVRMIDRVEDMEIPADNSIPLLLQRHWGFFESEDYGRCSRCRTMHIHRCGHYTIGRHYTLAFGVRMVPDEMYCVWFGWSPYVNVRQRKMAVQQRIPAHHFQMGWGVEHNMHSVAELDGYFHHWNRHSYDLYSNECFLRTVESCRGKYPDPYLPNGFGK